LAQELRGIMVLAAIGLLAILLPFARHAIPLCLGILSAVVALVLRNGSGLTAWPCSPDCVVQP